MSGGGSVQPVHERIRTLVLAALLLVVASACRVDVEVGIDARSDGSGQVRVEVVADRDAAAAVDLSKGVRVDDLKQAGWTIHGPDPRPGGGVGVVATKPFRDLVDAESTIGELSGPDGPFQGFRLERSRSFARTTTRFAGRVDLGRGVEAFGDPGLRATLGGSAIGIDLARLEETLKVPLDRAVGVQVAVKLPGHVATNAPTKTAGGARWELRLGDKTDLMAQSRAWNTLNLVAATAALAAIVGLLALLVTRRRR